MRNDPFASLPGNLGQRAAAVVAQRETQGLNVHFINELGQHDRYSFGTAERANAFRAKMLQRGAIVFECEEESEAHQQVMARVPRNGALYMDHARTCLEALREARAEQGER